jgi:hypothetical protein
VGKQIELLENHADLRPDGIDPLDGLALAEGMEMEAIVAIDTTSVADDVINYA